MKAVIIAGGEGTRLRPVTYEIPKPLIPVQGRPVIEYSVDNFLAYGCEKVIIVISVSHEKQFLKWRDGYTKDRGVPASIIEFVLEEKPRGTFAAIYVAKDLLGKDENFFVSNADELKDINLAEIVEAHDKNPEAVATMPLVKVNLELAKSLGNAELNENDQIVSYVEKPERPFGPWVSMGGPYVMTPEVFSYFNPEKEKSLIEYDLWEMLPEKKGLYGYRHNGQYFGTDTLEKWERAIKEYVHKPPVY